jgi:DNA-binding LacI/PurR family transcriptional regulator
VADLQEQSQIKQTINRLFSLPESQQPEAIIASNDTLALNVINSLTEMGIQVGSKAGQIAVTGFDDLPFAAFLRPALTTARQPIEDTCAALLELLAAIMRQDEAKVGISQTNALMLGPKQYLLKPELVIRESA